MENQLRNKIVNRLEELKNDLKIEINYINTESECYCNNLRIVIEELENLIKE
jgi:hypothetical protein